MMSHRHSFDMEFRVATVAEIEPEAHRLAQEFFGEDPYELGNFWTRVRRGGFKVNVTAFTPREKAAA